MQKVETHPELTLEVTEAKLILDPFAIEILADGIIGAPLDDRPSAAVDRVITVDCDPVVGSPRIRVHLAQAPPAVPGVQ